MIIVTSIYNAGTPEVDVTTSTTANVVNAAPIPQMSQDDLEAFARFQEAKRANPEIAARIEKILDKSDAEGASAVRGKVMAVVDSAIMTALTGMLDSESETFIAAAEAYMNRVGKITTTTEIEPDGTLKVSTKSTRRKREGSESTAKA